MLRSLGPIRFIVQGATIGLVLAAGARAAPTNPDDEHPDLAITAALSAMRDDNLFRLADGVRPSDVGIPNDNREDSLLSPSLTAGGALYVGRQELDYQAGVSRQDFRHNRSFDQTFRSYAVDWKWQLTNEFDGEAGNSLQESQTSFANYFSTVPNRENAHKDNFSIQWHPRPDRRLGIRYEQNRGLNSLAQRNIFDFRNTTFRLEAAADSALGHEIVLGVSQTRTEYPNRQIISYAPIDNSFRQHQVDISTRYAFSGKSSVDILYGYARRSYADVPDRDFSGPVGSLALRYQPGDRLGFTASISRDLNAIDDLFRLYTVTTSANAGIGYAISSKVQFEGGEKASRSDYKGEPVNLYTLFLGPAAARIDRYREIFARLVWSPRDRWNLQIEEIASHRTSNAQGQDFRDRMVRVQLSYRVGAL